MNRKLNLSDEIKDLLKKSLQGKATAQELAYLKLIEKTYSPEEWNKMLIDVIFEVTAEERKTEGENARKTPSGRFKVKLEAARRGQGQEISTTVEAPKFATKRKSVNRKNRILRALSGVAACVVLLAIYQVWKLSQPTYVLDELQWCAETSPDAEIPLSTDPIFITLVEADSSRKIFNMVVGDTLLFENTQLFRNELGTVFIKKLEHRTEKDLHSKTLYIYTKAYQQIELNFIDLGRIRLDAGSQFSIRLPEIYASNDSTVYSKVSLLGQAYFQMSSVTNFFVQTNNGLIQAKGADFVVRSTPNDTKTTLITGQLSLNSRISGKSENLTSPNRELRLTTLHRQFLISKEGQDSEVRWEAGDQWNSRKLNSTNVEEALTWTRAVRKYHDISMRDFVADMSRWYGIKFKDLNCIPSQIKINVEVCNRADHDELITFIRDSGIPVIEHKTFYSFCD